MEPSDKWCLLCLLEYIVTFGWSGQAEASAETPGACDPKWWKLMETWLKVMTS